MKKKVDDDITELIVGLFIITILLFSPLINKISWGHDFSGHLTNMEMFMENLVHFDLFSFRIFGSSVAKGFGYGTFIFYPCLSYICSSVFAYIVQFFGLHHSLGITYAMFFITFLSSLSMFFLARKIYKDNMIAFICSAAYITSTYYLCDIYTRTALAECLMFLFIPVVFSSLYELFWGSTYKFYILFVVGYVGMINSHLVMSVYLTLFIIVLFLINFRKVFVFKNIKKLAFASLVVLLVSSPFLVLLLQHKFLGNYVVFDNMTMFSVDQLRYNTLSWYDYLHAGLYNNSGIAVYLNYVTLILFVLVCAFRKKTILNDTEEESFKSILAFTSMAMFMTLNFFLWQYTPYFLQTIQFPWRLCSLVSFGMAILCGSGIRIFKGETKKIIFYVVIVLMVLFSINSIDNGRFYVQVTDYEYSLGVQNEYFPVNIRNNMNYYENRDQEVHIINGKADVKVIENKTPYLYLDANMQSDNVTLEIPRIYYLGYKIELHTVDGKKYKLDYYEDKYGFIAFDLFDSGIVTVNYTGTTLLRVFSYISPVSLILFVIVIIVSKKRKKLGV